MCLGFGLLGNWQNAAALEGWYASINKPAWVPGNQIYKFVWPVLYIMMGISLGIIWHTKHKDKRWAIYLFAAQFILNFLWSYCFFTLHNPGLALLAITLLMLLIAMTIFYFMSINKIAASLLVPYFAWVLLATLLNNKIFLLN